jgi:hypothetical protein
MFISRSLALGLTCILLAAPAAGAQDLRSPDARDAAAAAAPTQDLRSADARDAARDAHGLQTQPTTPATISPDTPRSASEEATRGSTDWTMLILSAGGFALVIALVVLAAGHRARRRIAA